MAEKEEDKSKTVIAELEHRVVVRGATGGHGKISSSSPSGVSSVHRPSFSPPSSHSVGTQNDLSRTVPYTTALSHKHTMAAAAAR